MMSTTIASTYVIYGTPFHVKFNNVEKVIVIRRIKEINGSTIFLYD